MRSIPIAVMETWPAPNYEHPVTRAPDLLILNAVLLSVVISVVLLRLYIRVCLLKWFGLDDLFIIAALLSTMGLSACVILASQNYGWDRHIYDLPPSEWAGALKIAMAAKIIFSVAACFTRLSLLTFYYRLVQGSDMKAFRNMIHLSILITVSTVLALILLTIFQCSPISAFWTNPLLQSPGSRCLDEGWLTFICGVVNLAADLLVTILPIPLIAKLSLPSRRRIGAIILVSLGFIVCIAGGIRSYFVWLNLIKNYDETWDSYGVWLSAAVEIDLGVICACAPALRLVLVRFLGPHFANLSEQLSSMSPFQSRNSQTIVNSASEAMLGYHSGELAKNKRHSTLLREKGFIITRGTSSRKPSNIGAIDTIAGEQPYLWDEPYTGNNGPREPVETTRSDENLITAVKSTTSLKRKNTLAGSITRTTSISTVNSPCPTSDCLLTMGPSTIITVMPSSPTGSAWDEHEPLGGRSSLQRARESLENRFSEEQITSASNHGQVQDMDADAILPNPYSSKSHDYSIGFPSIVARTQDVQPQLQPKRSSRISVEYDTSIQQKRSSTITPPPLVRGRLRRRFSWLSDDSKRSVNVSRTSQSLRRPARSTGELGQSVEHSGHPIGRASDSAGRPSLSVGRPSSELTEDIGRENMGRWKPWAQAKESRWDLDEG